MKFSTREDIAAPIEDVFKAVTTFEMYERAAMRRGADVRRRASVSDGGLGTQWDTRFMLKGKMREMAFEVTRFGPPSDVEISLISRNIAGAIICELFALSQTRTRMTVSLEARPLTLPARVLIQSLKLTKSNLNARFKKRVAELVRDIESSRNDRA